MTKKDFELIAKALKESEPTETEHEQGTMLDGWLKSIKCITVALAKENPRFNTSLFIKACGINE